MNSRRIFAARAVVLPLCLSSLCLAQSAPAARNSVVIVRVKPDMVNEWIALQKNELIPAQKKAGVKTRTTYQTVLGNSFEYVTVTPSAKFAELDGPGPLVGALGAEGAARLTAKLSKCLDSRQVFISNSLPELSYLPTGELPPMGVFSRRRIAPGKMQEYEDFIKTEILPVYKKAKEPYTVTRRGLGANNNDVTSISWVNKATDLDAGPPTTRALGAAGAAKLAARTAGLATLVDQVVRRRVAELSY